MEAAFQTLFLLYLFEQPDQLQLGNLVNELAHFGHTTYLATLLRSALPQATTKKLT